jgi:hypothetical protein
MGEAAHRVTAGDMTHAAEILPEVSLDALSRSYADAFTSLLHVLIVITLLASFATFAFLSKTPTQDDERGVASGDEKGVEPRGQCLRGAAVDSESGCATGKQ